MTLSESIGTRLTDTTGNNEFGGDKNQRAGLKAREPDCFVTTGTNVFRGDKNSSPSESQGARLSVTTGNNEFRRDKNNEPV